MAWIATRAPNAQHPEVAEALREVRAKLPAEYSPAQQAKMQVPEAVAKESIVLAHSLIPDAMKHAVALMTSSFDPSLPLSRREHELIAAVVSSVNGCFY